MECCCYCLLSPLLALPLLLFVLPLHVVVYIVQCTRSVNEKQNNNNNGYNTSTNDGIKKRVTICSARNAMCMPSSNRLFELTFQLNEKERTSSATTVAVTSKLNWSRACLCVISHFFFYFRTKEQTNERMNKNQLVKSNWNGWHSKCAQLK